MKKGELIRRVTKIAEEVVAPLNIELVDVQLTGAPGNQVLSIFIDKTGGIGLTDCEQVHIALNPLLDALDPIQGRYFLEVSSPGIERPLKTDLALHNNIGAFVFCKLYKSIEGSKTLSGYLTGLTEDSVTLSVNSKSVEVPKAKIALIRLALKP